MKNPFSKLLKQFRYWRDNRRLIKARNLIQKVYKNELPGTIMRIGNTDVIVTDITFSLKNNTVLAKRTKVRDKFTRRQQSAIYWKIKNVKRINETN